ncbi:MAG TPA: glycosyltransferase, partial [Acidimicrobiales bacterium]|nr:glycosyltransferase [Acidimicrobiales bacterium]
MCDAVYVVDPRRAEGPMMRVAIVHDYLTQRGGAERVVLSMHRIWPDAPIFTSIYDPKGTFPELAECDVRATVLTHIPNAGKFVRALLPVYPAAFRTIDLRAYDLVVSSTTAWAHGVRTPNATHVTYCNNPARWLYRTDTYLAEGGAVPSSAAPLLAPLFAALRRWDQAAAKRPDVYVSNSKSVAARVMAAYGRTSEIVHPPVDTGRMRRLVSNAHHASVPSGPFWLVVGRMLPYKRIDVAVEAAARAGTRLVAVGDGPTRSHLESIGGPGLEIRSGISDDELGALYNACIGLVLPGEEDFGIVPLEANAVGKPVVAFGRGGALETVIDGRTGVLVPSQDPDDFGAAMAAAATRSWDADVL